MTPPSNAPPPPSVPFPSIPNSPPADDGAEHDEEDAGLLLPGPGAASGSAWKLAGGRLSDAQLYSGVVAFVAFECLVLLVFGLRLWVPYLLLQVAFSSFAPLSGSGAFKSWVCALACAAVLSAYKTSLLSGSALSLPSLSFVYCTTSLWDCSTASLYFSAVRAKLNSTTPRRCAIQSLVPCSVQFEKRKANLQRRGAHIAGCGAAALASYGLYRAAGLEEKEEALKTLFLLPILGLALPLFNVPSYLFSLLHSLSGLSGLDADFTLLIIQPYGPVLLSSGPSSFWSRWSRPATLFVRHLFYHPLGGPSRKPLTVVFLFFMNALAHFDVGKALVGERRCAGWIVLFGTLGLAAVVESIVQNKHFVRAAHWASLLGALHVALFWVGAKPS